MARGSSPRLGVYQGLQERIRDYKHPSCDRAISIFDSELELRTFRRGGISNPPHLSPDVASPTTSGTQYQRGAHLKKRPAARAPAFLPTFATRRQISPEEIDYGRRLLDHIGNPQKGNIVVVADSIRAFSKSNKLPLPVGFEQMLAIVDEVRARGDPVDHLFFLNGHYNNLNPRSKFDVASDQLRDHLSGEFVILDKQQSRAESA